MGFLRVGRELACDGDDLITRHPGDLFGPRRGIRQILVIGLRRRGVLETAVKTIIGHEKIEHGCHQRIAAGEFQLLCRN